MASHVWEQLRGKAIWGGFQLPSRTPRCHGMRHPTLTLPCVPSRLWREKLRDGAFLPLQLSSSSPLPNRHDGGAAGAAGQQRDRNDAAVFHPLKPLCKGWRSWAPGTPDGGGTGVAGTSLSFGVRSRVGSLPNRGNPRGRWLQFSLGVPLITVSMVSAVMLGWGGVASWFSVDLFNYFFFFF